MTLKNWKLMALAMLTLGLLTLWVPAQAVAQGFTFISWGDSKDTATGTPNTTVLSALSKEAAALKASNVLNLTFTMFAGDLCEGFDTTCTSGGSSGWKYAVNGAGTNTLFDITFPFRGNHDNDATLWDTFFVATDNPPTSPSRARAIVNSFSGSNFSCYAVDGCARTYSFDLQNSHFVGIDMPRGGISTMTRGQIDWLDQDLGAAEGRGITHTFIMDHGPVYYVDGHRSKPSSALITVMNSHPSIKATFHGHEHVMAYVHIDSAHIKGVTHEFEEFVTGAAGADLYDCDFNRLKNTGPYPDFCEGASGSSPDTSPGDSFGFMAITVNGDQFTVNEYIQGDNIPVNTWIFPKSTNP